MMLLWDQVVCSFSNNTNRLFQQMFPNIQITINFANGKQCQYLVKYGLAPHFYEKVLAAVSEPEYLFVVSCSESFNKVIQCWDDEMKKVVTTFCFRVYGS